MFWADSTMRDEPLFFVDRGAGVPSASLLFAPEQLIACRSGMGDVDYEAGRDFSLDPRSGSMRLLAGSRVPITTLDERQSAPDLEDLFHRRQVHVSYTHRPGQWTGYVPRFNGGNLPRTLARLRAGALSIAVAGDSISEGYSASGFHGVPPHQPPYPALVATGLSDTFGSAITLHNLAVAGWTSDNGRWDTERITATNPDLVIVAYGMNDASYAAAEDFAANIEAIRQQVLAARPDAEFVLVSPMLPNPEWDYAVMERFPVYRDALAGLCTLGTVLADVTAVWSGLLTRKTIDDLTGNGINHPNDFGHRVYAQTILALLVEDITRS